MTARIAPAHVRATRCWWPRRSPTKGFSLLEVLVAVIVLALGLLGMAGLQISALKSNDSAKLRTVATLASYDTIDRIRADPEAIFGGLESKQTSIPGDTCDGNEIAATDAASRWYRDFCAFGLPAPDPPETNDALAIDCTPSSPCGHGNCEIIVQWDDSRADPKTSATSAPRNTAYRVCTRLPVL